METSTSTPDIQNPELIKLPRSLRWGKYFFYLTLMLYAFSLSYHFYMTSFNKDLYMYEQYYYLLVIFATTKYITGFITILLVIEGFVRLILQRIEYKKSKLIVIFFITIFALFGYQGSNPYPPTAYPVSPPGCDYCGRPFRPRKLFSWFSKEAEVVKRKTWNTIK